MGGACAPIRSPPGISVPLGSRVSRSTVYAACAAHDFSNTAGRVRRDHAGDRLGNALTRDERIAKLAWWSKPPARYGAKPIRSGREAG